MKSINLCNLIGNYSENILIGSKAQCSDHGLDQACLCQIVYEGLDQ